MPAEIKLSDEWGNAASLVSYTLNTQNEAIKKLSDNVDKISLTVYRISTKTDMLIFVAAIPIVVIIVVMTLKLI